MEHGTTEFIIACRYENHMKPSNVEKEKNALHILPFRVNPQKTASSSKKKCIDRNELQFEIVI